MGFVFLSEAKDLTCFVPGPLGLV